MKFLKAVSIFLFISFLAIGCGSSSNGGGGGNNDIDGDGIDNSIDNCLNDSNADQIDSDGDGIGDVCDDTPTPVDTDGDGIVDSSDNCPNDSNADQTDSDGDDIGDVCDDTPTPVDTDGDGIVDSSDNCPNDSNADQVDSDGDDIGDVCDNTPTPVDTDGDGIVDSSDNCPNDSNADQTDSDGDDIGDVCDDTPTPVDTDGDGIVDSSDNCPNDSNADQTDSDGDGIGDACAGDFSLGCGGLISGSIDEPAEVDLITLSGQAGDEIDLTLVETGGNFTTTSAEPRVTVFAPSGDEVTKFIANSQNEIILPESGTYTMRVNSENLVTTGEYSIGMECRQPLSAVDDTITCGGLKSGSIGTKAEVDLITFSGQTGDVIDLTLVETGGNFTTTSAEPRVTVFAPSGDEVTKFIANSQNEIILPESGTYTMRVNSENLVTTGEYSIGMECRQPLSAVDDTITCGGLKSGSIGTKAEVDLITFSGQTGDVIDLTLVETGGNFTTTSAEPRVTVFAPSGDEVTKFIANSQNEIILPESGTYTMRVNSENLVTTGEYSIGMECRQPLSAVDDTITCGGLKSGSIGTKAEVDLITFSGQTGDVIDLTLVETGGNFTTTSAEPRVTVFAPSGDEVTKFIANSQNEIILPESGTYTMRVNSENLVTTGTYNIGMECL